MNCSLCGTPSVREDQRFCARCGGDLREAAAGAALPPADATVHTTAPPEAAAETVMGVPQAVVEPPPAYHQPSPVSGPLFAEDASTTRSAYVPPPPLPPPLPMPPVAAAQPSSPPTYAVTPPGRRRAPVVLMIAAAIVAALIGAGGVVLLFGNSDDDPSASDRSSDDRDDVDAAATTPVDDQTATETATVSESATGDPETFRCWNGGAVARLADCTSPTGTSGLAWVFPSSADNTCSSSVGVQRPTEVDCSPLVAGTPVRFHYSEWRSRAALEAYYGLRTFEAIGAPAGRDDLTAAQVVSRASDVGYKVAIYFSDPSGLWSVTIYAADESQYRAAVERLDVRPFRQLRGQPS